MTTKKKKKISKENVLYNFRDLKIRVKKRD